MKASRSGTPMRVLWWLSFAVFALGLIWLGVYLLQTSSQDNSLGELSAFVHGQGELPRIASGVADTAAPKTTAQLPTDVPAQPQAAVRDDATDIQEAPAQGDSPVLRYRELAAINPDFIGWISIADTRVDYPVMHSPKSPEKYLSCDFDGNYSFSGLPFLDAACDAEAASGNSIIYGHNMRNGSMFSDLMKYSDIKYLDDNPIIEYNTLYGGGSYRIIAVFNINTSKRDAPTMLCYQLINTDDIDEVAKLNSYIDRYALLRGEDAYALLGDRLLTLSTCAKTSSSQRLIVMARCVAYEEYE